MAITPALLHCSTRLQPCAPAPLSQPRHRQKPPCRHAVRVLKVVGKRPQTRAAARSGDAGDETYDVVVVGAGVAGLATALALHRVGLQVKVLERAAAPREGGAALSLWGNAWRALDVLGVGPSLRPLYLSLTQVEFLNSSGRLLRRFGFSECEEGPLGAHEVRGVLRADLLRALSDALPQGTVQYGAEIASVSQPDGHSAGEESGRGGCGNDGRVVDVRLKTGNTLCGKVLVGCDGANSVVASHLNLPPVDYRGYIAARGTVQIEAAALPSGLVTASKGGTWGEDGGAQGRAGTIRMVWGRGVRAGVYPITENLLYWFTCVNAAADSEEFARLDELRQDKDEQKAAALKTVAGWGGAVHEIIAATPAANISTHPITDCLRLPLLPWLVPGGSSHQRVVGRGLVTLAGDALHPMTPNLGQGACTALEDAVVLAQQLAAASTPCPDLAGGSSDASMRGGATVAAAGGAEAAMALGGSAAPKVHVIQREPEQRACYRQLGPRPRVEAALAEYERRRVKRTLPLIARSRAIGDLLQIDNPVVCGVRDEIVMPRVFTPGHFLDHALFDCGELPLP